MTDDKSTDQEKDQATSQVAEQSAEQDSEPTGGDEQDSGEKGGAQARIRQLSKQKNKLKEEAEHWKNIAARFAQLDDKATQPQPPAPPDNQNNYNPNEVELAYRTLAERGMATKEDLQQLSTRLVWDRMHDQNERRYNQSNSKYPEYDRQEVEEYARNHNIGDPTAAYQNMYFDEILDAVKSSSRGTPSGNTSEKPTKPSNSTKEPLTLESFREKLASDRGFYDELSKDPAKFDALVKELSA